MAHQQRGQLGFAEAHADAVAGDARLGDLELGLADAVPVTDADLVVEQAVHGEVLAEPAVAEVVPAEVPLPVPVRLDLVDEYGPLLTAVARGVALAVAVDVEPADHGRADHRVLPHTGVDGLALPWNVLRHTDIHRQQGGHGELLPTGNSSHRTTGTAGRPFPY